MDTQYTPAQEDGEMVKIREIFERAANAIVTASQLSKEVTQLRGEFDALRSEVESVRAKNTELDNELASTRTQRDQYAQDKQEAIAQLNATRGELAHWHEQYDSAQSAHENLSVQHEDLKKEHDNAQLRIMELEEETKELKAKLEKVKAVFGLQPRDVDNGRWQSPTQVLTEEQTDQPKTGTDPFWR